MHPDWRSAIQYGSRQFWLIGLLTWAGCTPGPVAPKDKAPIPVEVSPVIVREATDYAEFTGRTMAQETVEVRARISGYLQEVVFQEGQKVKEGDLLYRIDQRPYQVALEQAQSRVAEAESQIQSAISQKQQRAAEEERRQAELLLAQKSYDRTKNLADQGATTANAKDTAEANLSTAKSGLTAAQADMEFSQSMIATAEATANTARSAVESAKLNLEYTELRAPISGRIGKTSVTRGNLIQSGDLGTGPVLTTIVSINPIYVEFDVDEGTVLKVHHLIRDGKADRAVTGSAPVGFGLADEQGFPHEGFMTFAENRLSATTGTLRVRGTFDTGDNEILPGLFARVRVPIGKPHEVALISDRAVMSDLGEKIVYVVNDKHEVVPRPVKLGQMHFGLRAVEEGLKAGDRVIVNGIQRVAPGAIVDEKQVAMPGYQEATASPPTAVAPAAAAPVAEPPTTPEPAKVETPAETNAQPAPPQK